MSTWSMYLLVPAMWAGVVESLPQYSSPWRTICLLSSSAICDEKNNEISGVDRQPGYVKTYTPDLSPELVSDLRQE